MKESTKNFIEDSCIASLSSIITLFLKAWIVMLLWNWLMPDIFIVLPKVSYWQAFGIYMLFNILFNECTNVTHYLSEINRKIQ